MSVLMLNFQLRYQCYWKFKYMPFILVNDKVALVLRTICFTQINGMVKKLITKFFENLANVDHVLQLMNTTHKSKLR